MTMSLSRQNAFLHGELEEDIYMDQPEGFVVPGKEDLVCRLKKSLYGLKQSPRQWYKRFDSFMISQGFKRSIMTYVKGSTIYLLLYVDDMLIAAKDKNEIAKLKAQLNSRLGCTKKILGMEIIRDDHDGRLYLSQKGYIKRIIFNNVSTIADVEYMSKVPYSRPIGSLMYAMVRTPRLISCIECYTWPIHAKSIGKLSNGYLDICVMRNACLQFGNSKSGLVGYVDSIMPAICLTKDQMFHERTKHIDVRYHYIRGVIAQGDIKVRKISTHDNPADMMTKPDTITTSAGRGEEGSTLVEEAPADMAASAAAGAGAPCSWVPEPPAPGTGVLMTVSAEPSACSLASAPAGAPPTVDFKSSLEGGASAEALPCAMPPAGWSAAGSGTRPFVGTVSAGVAVAFAAFAAGGLQQRTLQHSM
ncbi:LOW QUALITY PROTEIN: hypothetical protein U9M48_028720 [Paspalum notatum var. saurae]|uniref:Reverse transcriptase Ty1/copia-type domain-containing protein n=1 Tax=Paspalum notatum var. saurae TaxID=547442 RepID=A0AAQ3TX05_PASNO